MSVSKNSSALLEFLKSGIAPRQCVGCHRFGVWMCDDCRSSLVWVNVQKCYICGKISEFGKTCDSCKTKTSLDGLVVGLHFEDGPIRKAIYEIKYDSNYGIGEVLVGVIIQKWEENKMLQRSELITFVPQYKTRERLRGYNQSKILAELLAKVAMKPCGNLLVKKRATVPQADLTRRERSHNLLGSFEGICQLNGERVILVDDVATTGATLAECARLLKQMGASKVYGLVIARG